MAFMSLEIIYFRKKQVKLNFAFFFFFVYLLPGFINERSNNSLWMFKERAIDCILRAKVWIYGFENVFCQNLTYFLFVVYLLFFL